MSRPSTARPTVRPSVRAALALVLVGGCSSAGRGEGASAELAELHRADQAARAADWSRLGPEELMAIAHDDARRLARVRELAAAGALHGPADQYHAAMVLQHGSEPDDFLLAHVLAGAAALGGDERGAWLAAASLDRYLHRRGDPQWFGTQYTRVADGPWTQEPLATQLSDDVRAAYEVPPLAEARGRLARLNAELPPEARAATPPVELELDAGAAIDRIWDAHLEAARGKDLAGVLAMYAEGAVMLESGGEVVRGRASLEEREREGLADSDVGDDVRHVRHALRLAGDLAFELGTIAGGVRSRSRGGEAVHVVWDFTALWRRGADGAWRVESIAGRAAP